MWSESTTFIEGQVARLQALVPPGEELCEFVARALDEQIASAVSDDTPMGIVPVSVLSKTQLFASARIAAELLDAPHRLATKPEGIVDLGVIEWLLRPALPLRDNVFDPLEAGVWKHLAADAVKHQSSSVCRLDVLANDSRLHIGTGFIAGKDVSGHFVIVTNAHVVEEALRIGWLDRRGIAFGCDFARFAVDVGGELQMLDGDYEIHPSYDLALLRLQNDLIPSEVPARPLPIASCAPEHVLDLKIGVLGHPAFDSRLDRFPQFFGFGSAFGVKRFSPGLFRALDERVWRGNKVKVVLHDATTLSGSSGSCILDLNTMKVMGIHFGGWPLHERQITTHNENMVAQFFEANGAIPLWSLCRDPWCSALSFE